MKKIIYLFTCIFLCLMFSGCTKHIYYLGPEIRGQLYNADTKQPIANTAGYLGIFLAGENSKKIKTDATGAFTVPAYSHYYYYFKPNSRDLRSPPILYISFSYYEPEMYNYSKGKFINNVTDDSSVEKFSIIDVGKVYLKPDPEFRTHDEDN